VISLRCAIDQVWGLNWSRADAVHQLLFTIVQNLLRLLFGMCHFYRLGWLRAYGLLFFSVMSLALSEGA